MSDVFIDWLKNIERGDKTKDILKNFLNLNDYSLVDDETIIRMYIESKNNSSRYYEEKQSLLIVSAMRAGISEEEVQEMIYNLEESGFHFHPNIEFEISNDPEAKLSIEAINYVFNTVGKDPKLIKTSSLKNNK